MHIVLFCATRRGLLFLKHLKELVSGADLTVFSFRETPWEPPFLDEIREAAKTADARFFEARQVDTRALLPFWDASSVDLMLTVNWRYLLPAKIYRRARLGAFAFHDSLLPEY